MFVFNMSGYWLAFIEKRTGTVNIPTLEAIGAVPPYLMIQYFTTVPYTVVWPNKSAFRPVLRIQIRPDSY